MSLRALGLGLYRPLAAGSPVSFVFWVEARRPSPNSSQDHHLRIRLAGLFVHCEASNLRGSPVKLLRYFAFIHIADAENLERVVKRHAQKGIVKSPTMRADYMKIVFWHLGRPEGASLITSFTTEDNVVSTCCLLQCLLQ